VFKPNSIYVPFGLDPKRLEVPLAKPTRKRGVELVQGRATEIDPDSRQVLVEGRRLPYDRLVVATGSGMRADEIPGLGDYAISTWTPEDMLQLRSGFERVLQEAGAGNRQRVLFLIPPNNKCAGPLYEIVLMFETWLRRKGGRAATEITWWHAMGGELGKKLDEIVAKYNASQGEYKVTAVYKGSYPETMTAAIAAFRAKQQPDIVQVFEVGTGTMMAAKGAVYPVYQLMKDTGTAWRSVHRGTIKKHAERGSGIRNA
jgi:NADPH-dependent 2,4-dienoyl-CoA reductase/sulfur reductase-like enzyme